MRNILIVFFTLFTCVIGDFAKAEIPADVMAAYKSYNSALQKKDFDTALKHAKTAWEKSEGTSGESKLTGDLAYNYGFLAGRLGKIKQAVKPLIRSAELAHFAKQDAALIRLEREVEIATVLLAAGEKTKAWKRLDVAREFAGANNIDDSVFAGELMVHQSRIVADRANRQAKYSTNMIGSHIIRDGFSKKIQSKSAQFSYDALEVFSKHPQSSRKTFRATAHKLIGFSHERDKEWKEALFAYQKAMEIQKTYSDIDDRAYITTIGRWINVRTHFTHDVGYKAARKQGLCKCWPFHQESAIRAVPIKRYPPNMPSRASTSGFSIVRFDLDDAGNVVNPEILQSWPEKVYNKSSMRSLKRWKYETKKDGKAGAQRTGIVTTIKYILIDYMSDDPI